MYFGEESEEGGWEGGRVRGWERRGKGEAE